MKTNSTLNTLRLSRIFSTLVVIVLISATNSIAQKWSGVNGNEWLEGKYSQPWVRIGVTAKGLYKVRIVDLPTVFQNADKSKLELWHRGTQVSLIKADATEIVFYGVPNDGASDTFLYRLTSSRRNPYTSLFSDESSYFLTINPTTNGNRAVTPVPAANGSPVAVPSHVRNGIRIYANEYSHSTAYYYRPATFNSFYEDGKQFTGTALMGVFLGDAIQTSNPKSSYTGAAYTPVGFSFQLKYVVGNGPKKVTVHLKSRLGASTAGIYIGKDAASLRLVGSVSVSQQNDYDFSFDLLSTDYDSEGRATLGFKSTQVGGEESGYSVSYFTLQYDQALNMTGSTTYEFALPAVTAGTQSSLSITGAPTGSKVYDITNPDVPRIISSTPASFLLDRDDKQVTLFTSATITQVATSKISTATFNNVTPSDYNYLIVCSNSLVSSAETYATYRRTGSPLAKYKPLVMTIRDIYNQFNYGEPSPVAVRRFVDFMISDGNKDSKYLLLLGKSTTYHERAVREMPDEVPTFGYPGSDLLLTDGLAGSPDDVPAVATGRVAATSDQQVLDYLAKVSQYEGQSDRSWRKNVIHMNGGKVNWEITEYAGYLTSIAATVSASAFGGNVIPKQKPLDSPEILEMSYSPELNGSPGAGVSGVGMVTYFGHGGINRTDYDAGYVSDNTKGYNNPINFPVLFYNGCGVSDIFRGRYDLFVTETDGNTRPMSLDWLLTPNKGAVIVFGNSWDAYASTSKEYLDRLYAKIFVSDEQRLSIGNILKAVALTTKQLKGYTYNVNQNARTTGYYDADRANVHQVVLQGDPALRILVVENPLPVTMVSIAAKPDGDKVRVEWKTASEKDNSHFIIERSYNGKLFEEIGRVEGKGTTEEESNYVFNDLKPLTGTSYYRLKQVDFSIVVDGKTVEGKSTYSKIVSVNREESKFLVVSPNPVLDVAEIALDAPVAIKSWDLINAGGKKVMSEQLGTKLNASKLASGEYILKILTVNGDIYHKKIVKQ